MPLYRRVLGRDFEMLPPLLRRFHAGEGTGEGRMTVERGGGAIRALLVRLLRLPRPGRDVRTTLEVRCEGERERWVRCFGRQRITTVQREREGLLIERAGPVDFAFRVTGDGRGMTFAFDHARLLGLPLPRPLSLRIDARVECDGEECWSVEVRIAAPLAGTLLRYHGTIAPHL